MSSGLRGGKCLLGGAGKVCLANRRSGVPCSARALNQPVASVDFNSGKLLDLSTRPVDGHLIDDVGRAQPEVEPLARLRQKPFPSSERLDGFLMTRCRGYPDF